MIDPASDSVPDGLPPAAATTVRRSFGALAWSVLIGLSAPASAQGIDPAAATAARVARSTAVESAVRAAHAENRAMANRAAELINNIRNRLDACGDEGMLAMHPPAGSVVRTASVPRRPPLVWNPRLAHAAQAHSLAMSREQFFDHVDPRGNTVGQRAREAGYRWRVVGENLAAGQESIDEAVRGWLLSTGHCRNLIDGRFTEFGIARVDSTNPSDPYGSYWTLVLGMPRERQFAAR